MLLAIHKVTSSIIKADPSESKELNQRQTQKQELKDLFLTKINPMLHDPPKGSKAKNNRCQ